MGIFDNIFRSKPVQKPEKKEERSFLGDLGLTYNSISSFGNNKAMQLATAYACTNILSNSVALLPIKVVKYTNGKRVEIEHPLGKILNLTPNKKYNRFNFFKLLIESMILNGNGYAYIERDERLNVKGLHLIDPAYVTPMPQEDGTVKYIVAGMDTAVDQMNMIHLFQHVDEMYRGIPLLKYAIKTLESAWDTESQAGRFYRSGSGLLGVLKASAPLTDAQKTQIAMSWEKSISKTSGGGVAILPQGLDFQAISVDPESAQLLESRNYDVIQICRFFNVSPLKVFDYSHMSYSSLEQVSLSYLQDSVLPYTQLIADEFSKKLFKPSEVGNLYIDFDYSQMLATDKKSEAEYYRTLLTNGIISVDEIREKLGFAPIGPDNGGDAHFIQISYGVVKDVVDGAYIKQQGQEQDNSKYTKNDNKVTEG